MNLKFSFMHELKRISVCLFVFTTAFLIISCSSQTTHITLTDIPTASPSSSATYTVTSTATQTPTLTPSVSPTETPTLTPTSTSTSTPTPTVFGNAAGVLLSTCNNPNCLRGKIFHLDPVGGDISIIGEEGYRLQDVSPEGKILYSYQSSLYTMDLDGNNTQKIASDFAYKSDAGAYWLSSDEIVFISTEGLGAIYQVKSDGTDLQKIADQIQALELLPALNNAGIFWKAGIATNNATYNRGLWWSDLNENNHIELEFTEPKFSQSGQFAAYVTDVFNPTQLVIAATNDSYEFKDIGIYTATAEMIYHDRYFIAPDEQKIIIQEVSCDPKCLDFSSFLVALDGSVISELPDEMGDIWFAGSWSPDSKLFFYNKSSHTEEGYGPTLLDLENMKLTTFNNDFLGFDYLVRILWIPHVD